MPLVEEPWAVDGQSVCEDLGVDSSSGLSTKEAEARIEEYGPNELPESEGTPFWTLVLKQFEDLMVLILLGAAVVSFLLALTEDGNDRLTAFVEPAVILTILIANATVGVIQETNAEKSIEALKRGEARDSHAVRDGEEIVIHARTLVPGDIVILNVGDKVPADCRLLDVETATISIDEALLTGESDPASKHSRVIKMEHPVTADKRNCAFSGTLVVRGRARAVVIATGARTEMGKIAEDLTSKDDDDEKTPLQEKLDEFGEQLSKVIAVICIVVWLINIGHFTDPAFGGAVRGAIYYFKIAVALAVAAIPEGLPAVVTTCLALGTMAMARKNAIVRSLPSVETLGCTTVICSDKTGTLTTNRMSVEHILTVASAKKSVQFDEFEVEDNKFAPYGKVYNHANGEILTLPACESATLGELAEIATICNEATLQVQFDDKLQKDVYYKTGTPTEAALKVMAEKIGVPDEDLCDSIFKSQNSRDRINPVEKYWQERWERVHLLEFNRDRKSMSVLMRHKETGERKLMVKGAPEELWTRCSHVRLADGGVVKMTKAIQQALNEKLVEIASRGLRCLALCAQDEPAEDHDWTNMDSYAEIESNLMFVGMACMLDPPRQEVAASIAKCRQAGIRVIVITGDNKITAESICRRIGIFDADEDVTGESYTGSEFIQMSASEQQDAIRRARLFSRVEPKHKYSIVSVLKKQGEVVAMTGDGVNDAPALKAAHIGVAMGSGTDVAREASDMVLQDDNFATIVMAVESGRAIYANTKQFIRYLISSNIGEVACIFFTAAIGMPEALIPVQLLWVNLVTDGLPATALGFNPPDKDIMQRPPRDRGDGIINGWMFFRYMAIGIYVGIGTVMGFIWWFLFFQQEQPVSYAQLTNWHMCPSAPNDIFPEGFNCDIFSDARPSTISLSILVTIEMFNALNALSENQSLLSVPPWSNMWVVGAVALSFILHFAIVYIPFFSGIFKVAPLSVSEWGIVLAWSFPVFLLDEVLKFITRMQSGKAKEE